MKRMNFPGRKTKRREEAEKREEAFKRLSVSEQEKRAKRFRKKV